MGCTLTHCDIIITYTYVIILAVTVGPVREEQLIHDLCLLGTMTMDIAQILTRAGFKYI